MQGGKIHVEIDLDAQEADTISGSSDVEAPKALLSCSDPSREIECAKLLGSEKLCGLWVTLYGSWVNLPGLWVHFGDNLREQCYVEEISCVGDRFCVDLSYEYVWFLINQLINQL